MTKKNFSLVLAVFLSLTYSNLHAKEYELILEQAIKTTSASGDYPVNVYLKHDGASFTDAKAVSFYYPLPSWEVFEVDVSGLTLSGDDISGSLQTTVEGVPISINIAATATSNKLIKGRYEGTSNGMPCQGGIDGNVVEALNLAKDYRASVFLKDAATSGLDGTVIANLTTSGSTVTDVTMTSAAVSGTLYGSDIDGPHSPTFITPGGIVSTQLAWYGDIYSYNVTSHNLTLTADTLYGDIEVEKFNGGSSEGTFTYSLHGRLMAGYYLGEYTTDDQGTTRTTEASGNISEAKTLPTASLSPINKETAQSGTSFQPPYFTEIDQDDFYNRIQAATNWYSQFALIGAFASNAATSVLTTSGTKQYDNGSENAYGGAMGMLMLSRMTDDPDLKNQALQSAQRAGYWAQARGKGPYNVLIPYKTKYHTTAWQALTYLELYLETGDKEWLDQAKTYAYGLAHLQERVYDSVADRSQQLFGTSKGGAWTYYTPDDGYVLGQSTSRHDRSFDWYAIESSEFLYFLGKLRVEGGIDDFKYVEDMAYEWILENLTDGNAWLTQNQGAMGPSFFLLYMMHYADYKTEAAIDETVSYVEDNWTTWEHAATDFSPGSDCKMSRMQGSGSPETSTSLRMALAYMEMYQDRGDAVYLNKAKAMIYSVLSRQNDYGFIHFSGLTLAEEDFESWFAAYFGHTYSVLNSETLHLLYECYLKLGELDEFPGGAVAASLNTDTLRGEAPFQVNFDASASTGTSLTYEWDFNDGTTSTSASPAHTFDKAGNYVVSLTVTGSEAVVKKQVTIKVTEPLLLTEIELFREDDGLIQNSRDIWDAKNYITVGDTARFTAVARDQYGIPLQPQPALTWSADGANSMDNGTLIGQDPKDSYVYKVNASAHNGVEQITGEAEFCVLAKPDSVNMGFSVNYTSENSTIDHPDFVAGAVKLNNWNNVSSPDKVIVEDNTEQEILHLIATDASVTQTHTFPQENSDVAMSSERFSLPADGSIIGSIIPFIYKEKGYDVYVYSHSTDPSGHSVSLRGDVESSYDTTYWLKGASSTWDGSTYSQATAASQVEADAGGFTNYAVFRGLQSDSFYIESSYGVSGIQIVVADTFDVFAAFDMSTSEGFYPLSVDFDASESLGDISSYTWDFGDGDIASDAIVAHEFASEGEYTVSLTVSDGVSSHIKEKIVTVSRDTIPLEIDFAYVVNSESIMVNFTKEVDTLTAEDVANYSIDNGITISELNRVPTNPMAVSITTSTLTSGTDYTVTINNVSDIAPIPNVIEDNSTVLVSNTPPACEMRFDEPLSAAWSYVTKCEDGSGSVSVDPVFERLIVDASSDGCNTFFDRDYYNGIVSTPVSGDFEVYVQVFIPDGGSTGSRGGIILGNNLSAGPGIAAAVARPFKTEFRYYYDSDGDGLMDDWFKPGSHDNTTWLRMIRTGDTITSYYSNETTPTVWEELGSYDVGYGNEPLQVTLGAAEMEMHFDNFYISSCPMPGIDDKAAQTISFDPIPDKLTTDDPFTVSATASSDLPVSFEILSGPATLSGDEVSLSGETGVVEIEATQEGNESYEAATPVVRSFTVSVATGMNRAGIAGSGIVLAPNPANDYVSVIAEGTSITKVELYALHGSLLEVYPGASDVVDLDVGSLTPGMYLLRVYDEKGNVTMHRLTIR